jgi:hypothetical protein
MAIINNLGADILPGDFIFSRKDNGATAVCQVISFIFPQSLEVVWWEEAESTLPLDPRMFPNILRARFIELSPQASSVILFNDVLDIAFIFRAEVTENFWTDLAGMSRVFFTRSPAHLPFSSLVAESYPCRIWFSLLHVKEKLSRMMSSKRQMQLCKATTTTTFSLETWRYISRFFHIIDFQKFQTKVHQYSDLSLVSKSSVKYCQVIRIMNCTDLATARDLFGITFGIGMRNIPPRKGLPRKQLEVGNIINIIQPSDENCGRKFKEFIRHQRIDLVYEEACRNLTIRVVYSDVKAESEVVKETLRFPHAIQVTPAEDDRPQRVRKVNQFLVILHLFIMTSFFVLHSQMVEGSLLFARMMVSSYA